MMELNGVRIEIKSYVSKSQLMKAVEEIFDEKNFDPAAWSIYEAELFEMIAQKIREYYQVDV